MAIDMAPYLLKRLNHFTRSHNNEEEEVRENGRERGLKGENQENKRE